MVEPGRHAQAVPQGFLFPQAAAAILEQGEAHPREMIGAGEGGEVDEDRRCAQDQRDEKLAQETVDRCVDIHPDSQPFHNIRSV